MVRIRINGEPHCLPESLADITLRDHIALMEVEKTMPLELQQIMQENDPEVRKLQATRLRKIVFAKKVVPYFARALEVFLKMPADKMLGIGEYKNYVGIPVTLLSTWYWKIIEAYQKGMVENVQSFEIEGRVYHLPAGHMEQSTYGEFAEAAQYEEYAADVAAGDFSMMANVLAILLKEEGEKYDPDTWGDVEKRKVPIMMGASMQVVYATAFFLAKRNAQLMADMVIYTAARTVGRLEQV